MNKQAVLSTLSRAWNALDGWKTVIGFLIYFGFSTYDHVTGHKTLDIVSLVLTAVGWGLNGTGMDGSTMGSAVGAAVILVGITHKLAKANSQRKAGASLTDLLSEEGYISKIVDDIQKRAAERAKG